ncbi:SDR family oxidoreductase [Streptomyces sp. NPDC057137]|uniref:SDR family oxidoreductase n=1 Tax=Streptomyces sp. NPDC057137 TaxID=3346030 RepID=UPI00363FF5FE
MTYAITGATGYVGASVLKRILENTCVPVIIIGRSASEDTAGRVSRGLAAAGHSVTAEDVNRLEFVKASYYKPHLDLSLRDYDRIADATDHVLHFAANLDFVGSTSELDRDNVQSAVQMCKFAQDADSRLTYCSSSYVSGQRTGDIFEDELIDGGFTNTYERSKFLAEQYVRWWHARTHKPVDILRCGTVCDGKLPSDGSPTHSIRGFCEFSQHFEGALTRKLNHAAVPRELVLTGNPEAFIHPIFIDECADIIERIIRQQQDGLTAYHLTSGQQLTFGEMFSVLNEFRDIPIHLDPNKRESDLSRHERLFVRMSRGFARYFARVDRTLDQENVRGIVGAAYEFKTVGRQELMVAATPPTQTPDAQIPQKISVPQ